MHFLMRGIRHFGSKVKPQHERPWLSNTDFTKRVNDGWERGFYALVIGGFVMTAYACAYIPDTSIESWGRKEALARRNVDEVEYGKLYGGVNSYVYEKSEIGERPSLV